MKCSHLVVRPRVVPTQAHSSANSDLPLDRRPSPQSYFRWQTSRVKFFLRHPPPPVLLIFLGPYCPNTGSPECLSRRNSASPSHIFAQPDTTLECHIPWRNRLCPVCPTRLQRPRGWDRDSK